MPSGSRMACGALALALVLTLAAGCGGGTSCQPPPHEITVGDEWILPGTPVVKLVDLGRGELAALTERHAGIADPDGSNHYVIDHPRQVQVLRPGALAAEELAVAREGEHVTDIARGPAAGSLWVLTVRWDAATSSLLPRLSLFAGASQKAEVASFDLEVARFDALDAEVVNATSGWRYQGTPLDVLRLAARGSDLGVVGRNGFGTPYADRYRYEAETLFRTSRAPLAHPSLAIHQIMDGGTYDVLGQIFDYDRVHAALSPEGVLHAGLIVNRGGVSKVDALWGSRLAEGAEVVDPPVSIPWYVVLVTVAADGTVLPVHAGVLGPAWNSLLLSLGLDGERGVATGLTREGPDGASLLVLSRQGEPRRVIPSTHASAALQAILVDQSGRTAIAGSWGWSQNPDGLSIAGGERFLSVLPDAGTPWDEQNLLPPGKRRSEARTLVSPAAGVLCAGGMDDGPDTHAADADLSLLEADGFVSCVAW